MSPFNDIIFHFQCKENTISQSTESEQTILQHIPILLGGIVMQPAKFSFQRQKSLCQFSVVLHQMKWVRFNDKSIYFSNKIIEKEATEKTKKVALGFHHHQHL